MGWLGYRERRGGLTVASSVTVETAVSVTVMTDAVAVERKQLQALLMRSLLDLHCDRMLSAGALLMAEALLTKEMVGARFWKATEAEPVVLRWNRFVSQP